MDYKISDNDNNKKDDRFYVDIKLFQKENEEKSKQ